MDLLNEIEKDIEKIIKIDPKKIDYKNKEADFEKIDMEKEDYISYVSNIKNLDELNASILTIEFTNKKTSNIWNNILCYTSSVKTNKPPGKSIAYFLKLNEKIIGLVRISSAQRDIKKRDEYIGWTKEYQYKNCDYIFNISTCVAVQPIGYNFNIGKLLAMSVFSREVQEKIKEKYNHYAIAYYTFSIYGRSIQYERLKELKYIGLTSGESFIISDELYEKMKEYLILTNKFDEIKKKSHVKRIIIQTILNELSINKKELFHNIERGIYVGYCYNNSKELLCSQNNLNEQILPENCKPLIEIFNFWKERWAKQRFNYLTITKRVKHVISWSKLDAKEKNRINQKKYRDKMREELGEIEYKKLHNQTVQKYYVPKIKLHLIPENYNKIMEYKDKLSIKKVIIEMKGIIPDLTENKIKKIWSGILTSK